MKRLFRGGGFLLRLVRSYALVFGLLSTLILAVVYLLLLYSQNQQSSLNHQMLVGQPLKQVERFINEVDDTAYKVMSNQELISIFARLREPPDAGEEPDAGNYFTSDVMKDIDTASLLRGLNRSIKPAWRLAVYNQYGDYIYTGTLVNSDMVPQTLAQRDPAALIELFSGDDAPDYILYAPGLDPWSDYYKSSYISLIRPVMNVYSRDVVALVEVQQNMSVLQEYLASEEGSTLSLNIYATDGSPALLLGREDSRVVATTISETYGWTVELLESEAVLKQSGNQLLLWLVLVWLALNLVMLGVIMVIARMISRPLTKLTSDVKAVDITAPSAIPVPKTDVDEIVSLQRAFNELMETLSFSMEQEKKSFLLAMQAQMNPHFLYNVLSVINAVALEGREETVVQICGNLSGMLRYSSSYTQGTATVREELEHTIAYLELMKARYDYMFAYTVELDEALYDIPIPKLVIQPLCENAFTHPFAEMEPPYELAIRLYSVGSGWCIEVQDNGAGFDSAARQEVMRRANLAGYEDLSGLQIGGLGIISTVVRMKLLLKQEVHCEILDAEPHGAIVRITVGAGQGGPGVQ